MDRLHLPQRPHPPTHPPVVEAGRDMTLDQAAANYHTARAEFARSANDTNAAYQRHTQANTARTLRAWEDAIATHRANGQRCEAARDELAAAALQHTCP